MDTWVIVAIVVAAVLVVAAILALWAYRERRSANLRDRFGPEYERTVEEMGRGPGEKELLARRNRVKVLDVRTLSRDEYERFTAAWTSTQAHFVDDPSAAISQADDLVSDVMKTRGYPVDEDFERRAGDISVDHPEMVANYRAAHDMALRHEKGDATTEELRQAMVKYRALFVDLLDTGERAERETPERVAEPVRG